MHSLTGMQESSPQVPKYDKTLHFSKKEKKVIKDSMQTLNLTPQASPPEERERERDKPPREDATAVIFTQMSLFPVYPTAKEQTFQENLLSFSCCQMFFLKILTPCLNTRKIQIRKFVSQQYLFDIFSPEGEGEGERDGRIVALIDGCMNGWIHAWMGKQTDG